MLLPFFGVTCLKYQGNLLVFTVNIMQFTPVSFSVWFPDLFSFLAITLGYKKGEKEGVFVGRERRGKARV